MRSVYALLFCVLVASSHAMSLKMMKEHPISYKRNIMAVFLQAQAQIKAGGPIDDILAVFDNFSEEIHTEQFNHESVFNAQEANCASEFSFRENEIKDGSDSAAAATTAKTAAETQLSQDEVELANTIDNRHNNEARLEYIIEFRQAQRSLFVQRSADHSDAIEAIEECEHILGEMEGGASFAQIKPAMKKMLKHSVKSRSTKLYAPVMQMLAQMASGKVVNTDAGIEQIFQLLEKLKTNLYASQQNYQDVDDQNEADFQADKAHLEQQIQDAHDQEAALDDDIANQKGIIVTQTAIFDSATAKFNRNTELLNIAHTMCTGFEQEFAKATEARHNELDLVDQIKTIVESRFQAFSDQVRERGSEYVDQFAAYEDTTQYEHAQNFEFSSDQANEEGAAYAGFERNISFEKL